MEKINSTQSSVILSKTKDGCEKIIFNLSIKSVLQFVFCFLFSSSSIFYSMSPLGVAFYASVFSRDSWVLMYIISCASVFASAIASPWVYIASFTLVTVVLGVFDFKENKYITPTAATLCFFLLKLTSVMAGGFLMYDFFALVIEAAILFASVFVFKKGFPVIMSVKNRTFVSTVESICTMTFLALVSMSLSDFPDFFGFNVANVLSILMIYIFSLGGISGGAVVLGVILGTVGSLKLGSFAAVTSTFAFGAFLGSVLSCYGKIAVVLGFVIANTSSALFLAGSGDVALGIFDSLASAVIFMFVPTKVCLHLSSIFAKSHTLAYDGNTLVRRSEQRLKDRLGEMSDSFRDLSMVYASCAPQRELGKDYIMSKFKTVTDSACTGCTSKVHCFKSSTSKGYYHMSKMLETSFKTGHLSVEKMPSQFRTTCHRCDTFAEKFNSMFDVIKTEKQWLSKLNESRRLISDQLEAIADTLNDEQEKCSFHIDPMLEETLWAEFDKSFLYPSQINAEKKPDGDFCVMVTYSERKVKNNTFLKTKQAIQEVIQSETSCASPKRQGENIIYTFYPAEKYRVSVGYASKCKNGENISGDSFNIICPDGKTLHAVLSDGMGSGEKASHESKTTINLMEKFLKAGFDSDTAVRLINSSLLLKSSRDTFSTIDLCTVNLSDSSLTFTKLGAANSYIKSAGDVISVKGCSLPAGILRDIEVEKHLLSISSDTTVLLMSDGIADISLKNPDIDGWIEEELLNINTSNPQIIASKLMETALKYQKSEVHDDMTIIVISVKKV